MGNFSISLFVLVFHLTGCKSFKKEDTAKEEKDYQCVPIEGVKKLINVKMKLYYIPWAELLKRTFGIDIRACHSCGGRLQFIAAIFDGSAVGKISDYLAIYQGTDPPLVLQSQTEYDEYFD